MLQNLLSFVEIICDRLIARYVLAACAPVTPTAFSALWDQVQVSAEWLARLTAV